MTTLQKTLVGTILVVAIGIGIYQARKALTFRNQVSALEQQQVALTEQLTRDRDEATRQLAALRDENDRLNRNAAELLRLRGEVTMLRRENAVLSATRISNPTEAPAKPETPEAIYVAIGAATPEAGLQRLMAASKMGDTNSVSAFLGWQRGEGVSDEMFDQMHRPMIRNTVGTLTNTASIRIVNQQMEGKDVVRVRVEVVEQSGKVKLAELRRLREGDEWKPAVSIDRSKSGSYGAMFGLPLTPELGPVN